MPTSAPHSPEDSPPAMAKVVERNIAALLARRRTEEQQKHWQERLSDTITRFTGSMRFVYIHASIFGGWVVINSGLLSLPRFDPTFVILATVASVEAIFLSTFVLISQNRMAAQADKRAELDLHVSLLAEHEITRLVSLVSQMASKMGIQDSLDPELGELAQDVHPEKVLDSLEQQQKH